MSENFEKLVLEKLDKLESNQQATNERLDKVDNTLQNFSDRFDNIENTQAITNRKLNNLVIEVEDTQEIVKSINNHLVKLDAIFNDKIKILFDAYSENYDNHIIYNHAITDLNSDIFYCKTKLSALESKIDSNNKVAED